MKDNKIKAVIVEDSRLARAELKALLKDHQEIDVIAEAANCEEAISIIFKANPDVIFLDINLPDGSGFDILEKINVVPEVIFTTAYDQYAIDAFEINALDYLLKPIRAEKLTRALNKLKVSEQESEEYSEQLTNNSRIFVKDGERCWLIEIGKIRYFESAGNYSQIFFEKNKPLVYKSLSKIEERLPSDSFFRANRSQIVNLSFIKSVEPWGSGGLLLYMTDDKEIEVSRRHSANFKQLLSL